MRRLRLLNDERGLALILALGFMVVLSASAVVVIDYTSANQRTSRRASSDQVAYALAEAGVNNAAAVLGLSTNYQLSPTLLTPNPGVTCPDGVNSCFENSYEGGTTQWYGVYNGSSTPPYWTIRSWGVVRNPTGPGAGSVIRKVSARINVVPNSSQPGGVPAWNYAIARVTSNATTCDMTLPNTTSFDASLYVAGNLCLDQQAEIVEPDAAKPVTLTVMGKLALQSTKGVGASSTSPITAAHIGGGCTASITTAAHTCDPNAPTSDKVWARTLSASPTAITIPTADFTTWYSKAVPGPQKPCTTTSGTPPTFDNDATLDLSTNGSVPTFELTPSSSYTCQWKDAYGSILGEISWDVGNKLLTVRGAMYIDGSISITNGATNRYTGMATLYLTGTFSMRTSGSQLCGAVSSGNCDFSAWNPSSTMLLVVANGNNGSGNSVIFQNTVRFQGGLFATNAVDLGQSSNDAGPIIASTIKATNSVVLNPLPTLAFLPLGTPGNTDVYGTIEPATSFGE